MDWNTTQTAMAQAQFDQDYESWQARRNAAPDPVPWVLIDENAEPLRTDTTYNAPSYPVIENPGEPTWLPAATAQQIEDTTAKHAILDARWQLETNVQQALKKLFQKMVPKDLYSDAYPEPEDVDQAWVDDLLDHIENFFTTR